MAVLFGGLFVCIVLAGVASAAVEVHRERRAGVPVTRPAWDAKSHRAATGGRWATLRGVVKGLRS